MAALGAVTLAAPRRCCLGRLGPARGGLWRLSGAGGGGGAAERGAGRPADRSRAKPCRRTHTEPSGGLFALRPPAGWRGVGSSTRLSGARRRRAALPSPRQRLAAGRGQVTGRCPRRGADPGPARHVSCIGEPAPGLTAVHCT